MKKKKALIIIIIVLCVITLAVVGAELLRSFLNSGTPRGWVTADDDRRYYYGKSGQMLQDTLLYADGACYFLGKDGALRTGEQFKNGFLYYFDPVDGTMRTGFVTRNGKRFYYDIFGHKVTNGLHKIDGKTYLFERAGGVFIGQARLGDDYYYFDELLGMVHNEERKVDGKWFFYEQDGKRFGTGWLSLPNARHVYYDGENGMLYGEQEIDGQLYFLNISNGNMMTGIVYYLGYKYTIRDDGVVAEKVAMQILSGIDVSYFQGPDINWQAVAESGVQFAIVRAGWLEPQGGGVVFVADDYYARNVQEAQNHGISVGSYIYIYCYEQAVLDQGLGEFHAYSTENRLRLDLPVFLDVEDEKYFKPATDERGGFDYRTQLIRGGMDSLRGLGYRAGLYAYYKWANSAFDTQRLIDEGYVFWLARWYNNDSDLDPATMAWNDGYTGVWQYRDTGRVSGIRGPVDKNYMYLDFMGL